MSLIHWQPLRELDTLRQQMNRLFDEMIHGDRTESLFPKNLNVSWAPAIELKETKTEFILKAEVPGIDAKDLDVQVSEDAVAIAGEYKDEKRTEDKGFIHSEFRYGQFQRIIPLPIPIKNNQVRADFKHGVLILTLPKVEGGDRNVVKVDLTVEEKARAAMAKERQHDEHLQDTMHTRAAAELETPTDTGISEEARESVAEQRQHEEHLQNTMRSRTATEVSGQ